MMAYFNQLVKNRILENNRARRLLCGKVNEWLFNQALREKNVNYALKNSPEMTWNSYAELKDGVSGTGKARVQGRTS